MVRRVICGTPLEGTEGPGLGFRNDGLVSAATRGGRETTRHRTICGGKRGLKEIVDPFKMRRQLRVVPKTLRSTKI